jgi:phytoene dehydrogenase-like protein
VASQQAPVIVGAGHNGLTVAFYLAKAGLKPLVLERRDAVGGMAATEEIAPGYSCPTLAHAVGPLRPTLVRAMQLTRRGIEFMRPDPRLVALTPDGRALTFSIDQVRTSESIRAFSSRDAGRYPDFCATLQRVAAFLLPLLDAAPPSLDGGGPAHFWDLLKTGRRFRALGKTDGFRLLRWAPMPVADLVAEWFESDLLQAAIAARGIFGTTQGPWSAGTAALMLMNSATDPAPGGSSVTVKGGPGALSRAMASAAQEAGAEIRTGAGVTRVLVTNGRVSGVSLENGTEIQTSTVISNADPRTTLLDLIDPVELDPSFTAKVRNYRSAGTVAKVNLALGDLPSFQGITNRADLHGRIHIGPTIDYLERAFDASKYGTLSAEPYLDVALPTLNDPALAPPGKHVLSTYVQFAPYRLASGQDWHSESTRSALFTTVVRTLEQYAPGLERLIEHSQVITPLDLERTYGTSGGHILHGEPSLDQLFTMRPILGWARYRTPISGLFLCGSGTHPAGGITGASGQNAAREILRALK